MINIWLTESPVVRVSVCLEKSQQPCSAAKSRVQGRHALVCWWSDDNNGELAPVLTRECGHWSPLCSPGWDVQPTSTLHLNISLLTARNSNPYGDWYETNEDFWPQFCTFLNKSSANWPVLILEVFSFHLKCHLYFCDIILPLLIFAIYSST